METVLFPALDPIPLPAPVWLFVALNTLTLALHFFAVHFLVGGLAVASLWAFVGRFRKDDVLCNATGSIAHRLPVVMTYVINLGVPPLLFSQVLYGRALYTSSVLIGAWWISVIALLMLSYSLLYLMNRKGGVSTATAWFGLAALIVVMKIGMIYSTNMTLMLRPEVWPEIYRSAPGGTTLGTGDPTVLPRWTFMMLGSIGVSGLGLLGLSLRGTLASGVPELLRTWGGRLLAAFTVVQALLGIWVMRSQPDAVQLGFSSVAFYRVCAYAWVLTALLLVAMGTMVSVRKHLSLWSFSGVAAVCLVNILLMVLVRDGIRYVTLKLAGFNVWDRAVQTNWSTVVLFLLLLVVVVVMLGWLVTVLARAKPHQERYV
ncbi:MAG: hypothetical protein HYV27_18360 [Candidatus Hydrogenedentes bacterium]|nr:hypothetical protein [Candidatus Hydrogenedentota bacterium]